MLYQVKAGIIGLENTGKQFAALLKNHIKDLKLIAASGRTQREQLHAKNDLALQYVYSDHEQLIQNNDVDALFIFCPPEQKASIATRAIEAGKNVFIGLPMATNVEDAEYLSKVAASHPSQVTMAGFSWRLDKRMQMFKQWVDSGKIGKLQSVRIDSNMTQSLSSRYISPSGSPFIDHALTEIDLSLWLLGTSPVTVRSYEKGKELHARTIMEDGVIWDLVVYRDLRRRKGSIVVTGSDGVLSMDNYHSTLIVHHNYQTDSEASIFVEEELPFNTDYLHIRNFVKAIMGRNKSELTLRSNVEALRSAIAMEKSKVLGSELKYDNI